MPGNSPATIAGGTFPEISFDHKPAAMWMTYAGNPLATSRGSSVQLTRMAVALITAADSPATASSGSARGRQAQEQTHSIS